jgi:hypothetical protein
MSLNAHARVLRRLTFVEPLTAEVSPRVTAGLYWENCVDVGRRLEQISGRHELGWRH